MEISGENINTRLRGFVIAASNVGHAKIPQADGGMKMK
jgi:hypothetical protein